jgi:hypothetical protein
MTSYGGAEIITNAEKISNRRAVTDVIQHHEVSRNITALKAQATADGNTDDPQTSFYEKLGYLFDCSVSAKEKKLLGDFRYNVLKERIVQL